jgi:chloride channel, nucleotide-sensitive, 1A
MPAVTLITSTPTYVSPEEHRDLVGSTPSSFNDIPPVLRHKQENVKVTLDPPVEDFSDEDGAKGILYVLER